MSNALEEDAILFRPIEQTTKRFYLTVAILVGIIGFTVLVYSRQVYFGLGKTGLNQPVLWGFYIINFVFFIGISHAGTLISAILRLSKAEWRRPITRMAEVITAVVLMIGGLHPIFDIGRPDRVVNILLTGRLQSPLLWDVTSITTYLTASLIYLYVPMIPDIAILRDRGTRPRWLYEFLALGWQGTEKQHRVLERAINILMVMVIPIAISVHTVVSFIFSMTLQPMWHSTIFGPYFVVGAIFSGIAALLLVMLAFRKIYGLESYLKEIHFAYLGKLLLIMSLLWFYFTFAELLTALFGHQPHEMSVFYYKLSGPYAPLFWTMVLCNFLIPVFILGWKKTRNIPGICVASAAVLVGMWLERLLIIVPTLTNPRLHHPLGIYIPTFTEWCLFVGAVCIFLLGFLIFSKYFPIISIWEVREGREVSVKEVSERVEGYLPETT